MKYSVCTNSVFGNISIPEALKRIRSLGLDTFEFWSWWDQDVDAIAAAMEETGMKLSAMCAKMVPLNEPARREEYVQGLKESIAVAKRLGCRQLITQVGQELSDVPRAAQHESIVEGLKQCAPILEAEGIELLVEPLNTLVNHKGYYLARSDEAFEIIREVNSPMVRVLFDVYHQQITEGNLIDNLTGNLDLITHIHIAGNPGRHEPLKDSEVCYPAVLAALKRAGFTGAVGLEYFPLGDPDESLREIMEKMPL